METSRTIGGVPFNGTANINLPGVNTSGNQNTSGNAATATKLATARSITLGGDLSGSASFDGSANITITAVVADDSHNHTIANVDGLQTALDGKASLNGSVSTSFAASAVTIGEWIITYSAGTLYFSNGTTNVMKIDGTGNLTVAGDVTAFGTI